MENMVEVSNLREHVYDILKNMIIIREIEPGKKICEESIAKKIGVSRTPIRETLCRLENEGIVKTVPRRGAFVVQQSQETIREILQIREVLEGLVARLAAKNMDEKISQKIGKILERVSDLPDDDSHLIKYTHSEVEFHSLLLDACNNQMLKSMMQMVNAHLQIIRLRTVVLPGRARKTVQEHREIMDAVLQGNPDKAEELMRKHIESVRRVAIENIDAMV